MRHCSIRDAVKARQKKYAICQEAVSGKWAIGEMKQTQNIKPCMISLALALKPLNFLKQSGMWISGITSVDRGERERCWSKVHNLRQGQ